ncbi:vascular endothelial growth factor receptor 1 isoform X1 [Pieris napi]|uniref:vascular endothelial growth factor receptor 1 isoform X1 n=1 Tax=Pieris napi TaxID=78633 RepID=UPI001FB89471|nr:vascular endothelial growth factor receptor 1 isoform X1 [Pieris napi]
MFNSRIWLLLPYGLQLICLTTADTNGPIIIPSTDEITLEKGQNFTIICRSNKKVQIKQQELPEYSNQLLNEQTTVALSDSKYKYETVLELVNVSRISVGYYACFDESVNETAILTNIREEPTNTDHVAYIYIYVNGTDSLFAPFREMLISIGNSKVVIECKPTTPDVSVQLIGDFPESEYSYSPKIGFTIDSELLDSQITFFNCDFTRHNITTTKDVFVHKQIEKPPTPSIKAESPYFIKGETFSLNCTVTYQENTAVYLVWKLPFSKSVLNESNEKEATGGNLYKKITIVNATEEDAGVYTCLSTNRNGEEKKEFTKIYKDEGFINLTKPHNQMNTLETIQRMIKLHAKISDYPRANFTVFRDGVQLPTVVAGKYYLVADRGSVDYSISNLNINDTGNYTIVATNDYVTKNVTYDLRPLAIPVINFGRSDARKYLKDQIASIKCEAVGYPQPIIDMVFTDEKGQEKRLDLTKRTKFESIIKTSSEIQINARASGYITCHATNSMGHVSEERRFIIQEVPDGFGVKDSLGWYSENQKVELECYASKYEFSNVSWIDWEGLLMDNYTKFYETQFSFVAKLVFDGITLNDAGNYTCVGYKNDDSEESYMTHVSVIEQRLPVILIPETTEMDVQVNPYQPIQLTCQVDAVPPPTVTWYKDGFPIEDTENLAIITIMMNRTTLNSTVGIKSMTEDDKGKYECIAYSGEETQSKIYTLHMKETPTYKGLLSCVGVIVFLLIILIAYLAWRIRKMKQFKRELAAAGLLYFKEGVPKSLNPDLGIDEQAELLPYDDKFEFPPEKLKIGKQLGAGAFGVVYKAEARGIVNAEESTIVAVKTVKKTADNMYIKALASELKIMVHLGKHINIVNLLGACTKNAGKRELIVIVEYCKFGNIHNYLIRHREVFIDQLTDDKEKSLGKVNKAFSSSTASSGMHSDYYGSNHTQATDHTSLNSGITNRSGRKVSETGYVQPEWRSNYECDSIYEGRKPRPLTSRDLLAWAFQIARGMEYLASRKVLHGDLAARNVLLAEDNVVKICDFGLARSIYKNDEYQKKENSPLPVKWLAIECMVDRIFSTQSDIWSFGIVLWELFSLAQTPYPNISPANLLNWLSEGHRLEKPTYSDDRLYDVMLKCWEKKPTMRPSFSELQVILGSFLEDNVRNHYVDLNAMYMDINARSDQEDYLAMVSAPDYNNIVTPSPHHYTNDAKQFFPSATPKMLAHDDEGYLQMSPPNQQHIFSPRVPSTKFDFDARKLNAKIEVNEWPEESTPMLTLNNLPARTSESDDAYLNMAPQNDDEVFEAKDCNKNTKNIAASNPTYIMYDMDKKPHKNNYINVSNGLVK